MLKEKKKISERPEYRLYPQKSSITSSSVLAGPAGFWSVLHCERY